MDDMLRDDVVVEEIVFEKCEVMVVAPKKMINEPKRIGDDK